ncbi:MAG: hypothetical protein JWN78_107 [Bacteroidota bacterium]|nr:hypothetical protein [Bacteroidota bacterium]
MKKLLLILLLLGAIISQSEAKIQAGVGITVGPCFGRWNNQFLHSKLSSAGGTLNREVGVHAGINGRVWFNKFVGINLGVEFNMGGNKFQGYTLPSNTTTLTKEVHKENQLTIPLTAMIGWGNERLRIFFNGGGYFGYIISAHDKLSRMTKDGSETVISEGKSDFGDYNRIDLGVRVGGGIQVYVDKGLKHCVTFDVNYDFGLYKVFKNGTPSYFKDPDKVKLTPSRVMIGVGYIYSLGKSQAEEKPKRATE